MLVNNKMTNVKYLSKVSPILIRSSFTFEAETSEHVIEMIIIDKMDINCISLAILRGDERILYFNLTNMY